MLFQFYLVLLTKDASVAALVDLFGGAILWNVILARTAQDWFFNF
jgi:hypothetical protein